MVPLILGLIPLDCLVAIAAWTAETAATLAASAAAKSTVFFRTSFADVQGSAVELLAIQFCDCPIRFRIIAHLNESKASGLTGVSIRDQADTVNRTKCFKHGSNRIFGSPEAEIPYENLFHPIFLL
jgi:hypothetical protein